MAFDPYYDYGKVTEEMAGDLAEAMRDLRQAQEALAVSASPDDAVAFMKAHEAIAGIVSAVHEAILTVPAVVHVAGEKSLEANPDDPSEEALIQRCTRCGSILHAWYEGMRAVTPHGIQELDEDDIPWWDTGDVVGKSHGPNTVGMYEIDPNRDLEDHEYECAALNDLSAD